jgi:hypothetical protein
MDFKHVREVAVETIATHLGESIILDGHCIRGIPRIGTAISGALAGAQVRSTDASVSVLNVDADRLGLRKGMDVELRGKKWMVRDFSRGNSGWSLLELE